MIRDGQDDHDGVRSQNDNLKNIEKKLNKNCLCVSIYGVFGGGLQQISRTYFLCNVSMCSCATSNEYVWL